MSRPRIVAVLIVVIAIATLSPSGGRARPFNFSLTGNFRWLADWLANVALFVPLGLAVNWKRPRVIRTAFRLAAFSALIEVMQTTIPGRDPALSDIVSNSIGGAVGAFLGEQGSSWLTPTPGLTDRLLALAIVLVALIVAESAWLLAPSRDFQNGSEFSNAVAQLFRGRATLGFRTVSRSTPTGQPLLSLGPVPELATLYMARMSEDLLFRYRTRGRDLRLDQPDYVVPGFFDSGAKADTIRITVSRDGASWCISRTDKRSCGIGPTPGLGWAILRFPYSLELKWRPPIRDLWVALLFFPVGFWSRRRTLLVAAAAAAVILGPYARFTPLVPTPADEWVGAFVGLASGFAIRLLVSRRPTTARGVRGSSPFA